MTDSPCVTMAAGQCAEQLSSRYWAGHNLTEVCSDLNTTQQFSSIFSEAEGEASSHIQLLTQIITTHPCIHIRSLPEEPHLA